MVDDDDDDKKVRGCVFFNTRARTKEPRNLEERATALFLFTVQIGVWQFFVNLTNQVVKNLQQMTRVVLKICFLSKTNDNDVRVYLINVGFSFGRSFQESAAAKFTS